MKKVFSLIVLTIFMFSLGMVAYGAPDTGKSINDKKAAMQQKREEMQTQKQERQETKADLQPLLNQIKTNRAEILQLKAETRIAQQAALTQIKELKKNPDKLTDAQAEKLKAAKETLKESRAELAKSVGEVKTQKVELKAARQAKNSDKTKESLNSIIKTQQERVTILKGIIEDLKKIAAI